MAAVYPELDATSYRVFEAGGLFVGSLAPSDAFAGPRRYRVEDASGGCLFDGCAVDATGRVSAHDAADLQASWHGLTGSLEGQFTLVRYTSRPATLDVITDPHGMKQVYVRRIDGGWLVSNSVALLHRIRSDSPLDATATSLLLTMGWLPGDRTLREGIRVIPGGRWWQWREGQDVPDTRAYYTRARLRRPPRRSARETGDALIAQCRELSRVRGALTCPLTGGRDTRLLAALLIGGGVPATYYTDGLPESTDVTLARRIAQHLGLSHVHVPKPPERVLAEWEGLARRVLDHGDGMVSLWQIADAFEPEPVDRLRPRLWGAGGEVARGNYTIPSLLLGRASVRDVLAAMHFDLVDKRAHLVRPAAAELSRRFLRDFVFEVVDEGFTPLDALDLFYIEQSTRRWFGSNARKAEAIHDLFTPFCTRPFVEAAFALPARRRYVEPLHRALVRSLVPALDSVPYEQGPWRSRFPTVEGLKWAAGRLRAKVRRAPSPSGKRRAFDRASWIEARRSWIRSQCLDRPDSPVWHVVDRDRFEALTSDRTSAEDRRRHEKELSHVLTVFLYDAL